MYSRSLNRRRPRHLRATVCAVVVMLAAALGALTGPASPAQAQAPASSVSPIDTQFIDLGLLPTSTTRPAGGAAVFWNRSGGEVSPRVVGYLSLYTTPGWCSSVRLRYFTFGWEELEDKTEYSNAVCSPTGGLVGGTVSAGTQTNLSLTAMYVEVGLYTMASGPEAWQPWHTAYVSAH